MADQSVMRRTSHVVGVAVLTATTSLLQAQPAPAPALVKAQQSTPPPYTVPRWNEDWSYLRTAPKSDFFDPVKYIPIGDDGAYLSIGGQARYRYENFHNFNFDPPSPPGPPQDDDGYHLTRLLLHADFRWNKNLRVFAQAKSAMEDGREGGPRLIDADELDVHQLFVDLGSPFESDVKATARLGRQELFYGAQRLISQLDWVNTRRSFEGGRLMTGFGNWAVDFFWVHPVDIEKEEANWADKDTNFAGVYATVGLPQMINKAGTKLDLYFLTLNRNNALFAPNAATAGGDEDRYTIGARLSGNPKPFDFDVEMTYQFGKFEGLDVSAWSVATVAGYTLDRIPLRPRLELGFDYASGDDDPDDDDFNTFNQLFPLAHPYFGYIDALGRQNIVDLHVGAEATVLENARWAKKLSARVDYHWFWRASDEDAIYGTSAGGGFSPPAAGVLRGDLGSDETYIGSELDIVINWQIERHTHVHLGYSHFFAGTFIEDTGADDDIDFVYAMLSFTF